jgi:hypothetical protein
MTTFSNFRESVFLLADDPGAGKTIMAGLLLKPLETAKFGRTVFKLIWLL